MLLGNYNHTGLVRKKSFAISGLKIAQGRLVPLLGAFLASLLIWLPLHSARAQAHEEVVDRVQERYERTRNLEAHFTQRATLKILNETQLSSGKVYIMKPGKMRWDYLQPENQVILLNEDTLSVYTPEINQLLEQPVANTYRAKSPIAFLAGQGKIREIFWVRVEPMDGREEGAAWRLILTPKEENPQLKELRLEVAGGTYDIVRTVIVDYFGNVTDIRYENLQINGNIEEEIFVLKLPPGVQRVRPPSIPY